MMKGGEIFIPKLFSFRIRDLILTLSPKAKIINIGIRPGEKMHESLISIESYKSIIEFRNHYVVMPSNNFFKKKNYFSNSLNERGKLISKEFEYSSIKNKNFLNKLSDIKRFLKKMTIPYSRQSVNKKDIAAVKKVLNSNFLTQGPEVEKI